MEIAFQTAELRDICEKRAVAAESLGYVAATELAERLADIEAAETVAELCALLGSAVADQNGTEKLVHLSAGIRIRFASGHPLPPGGNVGCIDWAKVTRMKIVAIESSNA